MKFDKDYLIRTRKTLQWTQFKLAKELKTTPATVCQIEKGIKVNRTLYEPRTDFLFTLKLQHFGIETKTKENVCPNKNNN